MEEIKDIPFMEQDLEVEYFLDKIRTAKAGLGLRDRPNILWLDEYEDDSRVRYVDRNLKNGIPTMAQALTDGENGLFVLGGLPNAGKSTLITNMEVQGLQLNPELMIVDLSFDDDVKKRYQQWIAALTGLRYQEITTRTELSAGQRLARTKADEWLESMIQQDRLRIYDGDYPIKNREGKVLRRVNLRRIDNIISLMGQVRRKYPERKIAFFVDAWNDIDIPGSKYSSDLNESNSAVNNLKQQTHDTNTIVFMSCHLRKTQGRKASLEDLKGTSGLGYAAVWAAIFRNELRENAVTDPLVYEDADGRIWATGIVDIVKSKVSACDMPLIYALMADRCGIKPLRPEEYAELYQLWSGRTLG